jgi:hypothetical protein
MDRIKSWRVKEKKEGEKCVCNPSDLETFLTEI